MPNVLANGIQIEYEEFGNETDPTLLLIQGLSMQLIAWPVEFCQIFVDKGFHVIRYDNRDVGLSTHVDDAGTPDMTDIGRALAAGEKVNAPYTISDMGCDAIGLLDALDIEKTHVAGASMGGLICQDLAIHHGHRLLSMTSIMATSGRPGLPAASPEALAMVLGRPAGIDETAALEHAFKLQQVFSGSKYPPVKEDVYASTREALARDPDPNGIARQALAALFAGDRVAALSTVTTPTLVIHGTEDPAVPVSGGEDTAKCIPNAKLELIEGWGHSLPASIFQRLADLIVNHATTA